MANDLNRSIKLYIDGSEATNKIDLVKESISRLEDELKSLTGREADYAKRSQDLKKELDAKNRTLQNYEKQLAETERVLKSLSGATYNELLAVQSRVRKELRNAVPETKQYTAALEQNRRVTEALSRAQAAMRVEVGAQGNVWSRASGFINKYIGLIGTVIAAITGVSMKLNQLREQRNKREEAKADVEALTGLSKDDINWLEQQAVQLSTTMTESGIRIRQSATEILDAYKLVGSAKPELLDNKEALAEVTKQTLILASASGMTLKDAVDAVTLSLNQYGDGADQASRYANVMAAGSKYGAAAVESVTTAVTKSGVAAASAEIPIEQLVGTIETLAEKGIKDEIAGTGLKRFFLTLQTGADDTNPKIVGLEKALDNLQKKQLSASQIKKQFGEEGYNVASVLINEADKVKYYTQAVTGTSVAMEQAATKSETAAAKLDQAKNKMNELGIQLLEKLNPSITTVINGTVNWTRKIVDLIGFMVKHSKMIITLTTIIGSYLLVVKAVTLYETKLKDVKLQNILINKLWETRLIASIAIEKTAIAVKAMLTGNTVTLNTAMKALWRTIGLNPIAGTIALVLGLGVGFYQLFKARKGLNEEQKAANQIAIEANKNTSEETSKLKNLKDILYDSKKGYNERKYALEEIQKIVPDYHASLTKEGELINDNKEALDGYVEKLMITARQQAANAKLQEALNQRTEWIGNQDKSEAMRFKNVEWDINDPMNSSKSVEEIAASNGISPAAYRAWSSKKNQLDKQVKLYEDMMKEYTGQLAKVDEKYKKRNKENGGKGIVPPEGEADNDTSKKELKGKLEQESIIYSQQQAKLKAIYLAGNNDRLKTEKQFNEELECLKLEHLQRIIDITGAESKEGIDAQNQINDIEIKRRQSMLQQQIADEKKLYESKQNDLKALYISGQDDTLQTEQEYNKEMERLTMEHLERSLSIAGLDTDQRRAIEQQLFDFKIKCMHDEAQERKRLDEKTSKDRDAQAKQEQQRFQRRATEYTQYGQQLGEALGNIISKQENAIQSFADTMIDIVFDVLTQILNAELTKLTGVGISAAAEVTAREIGSKGFLGIGTGALLAGIISTGIAAAKSTLKGIIKGSRSSSGTDSPEAPKTAQVQVKQWASGRYDVIGEDDGRTYRGVPYIGDSPTGIVRRTSLISESGAELIINAEDLSRLQHHINYPIVVQAIQDARSGRVPQRAEGNYDPIRNSTSRISQTTSSPTDKEANLAQLIKELHALIEKLKYLKAYVVLRELNEAQELADKSKEPFTRKKQ